MEGCHLRVPHRVVWAEKRRTDARAMAAATGGGEEERGK